MIMFKFIRSTTSKVSESARKIFPPFMVAAGFVVTLAGYTYAAYAIFLLAAFLFTAKRIHDWSDRIVQGVAIKFYDDLLKESDLKLGEFDPQYPVRVSRRTLLRDLKSIQHDSHRCQVYLLELRRTLQFEAGMGWLPYSHAKRLIGEAEELFKKSQQLSTLELADPSKPETDFKAGGLAFTKLMHKPRPA